MPKHNDSPQGASMNKHNILFIGLDTHTQH